MHRSFLIIIHFVLIVSLLCGCGNGNAQEVKYRVEPQLERINSVSFRLEGRQKTFQDSIVTNWLVGLNLRNPYMTGMFEEVNKDKNKNLLPWSGEFAGKYLTGAVAMYRLRPTPQLKQDMYNLVKTLKALQTPDGYLGPWPKEYELTNRMPPGGDFTETWDAWNHYHLMIGLLEYERLFRDSMALEVCRRIGDRLCTAFLDQPDQLIVPERTGFGHGVMEFNLSPAHALCLLYRATGENRYFRLAKQIVEKGYLRYGDFLNRALAGKDFYNTEYFQAGRWERLHSVMALAELYWLTGREDYRKAFEQIWWSIARTDIHNTGGFSTDETAMGNPYAEGSIETCCTIAWQAMSVEMLKMTGNSVVADMLELSQFNAAYGSWDVSGRWNTYHTGMIGQRWPSIREIAFQIRAGTEELSCCSANAPRGVGILADWAVLSKGKELVLNWYGPGKITTRIGDATVIFTQTTDYPRSGDILIHVKPSSAISFPLALRIPFWSQITTVEVNNKKITSVQAGRYLRLDRKWKSDDVIKIKLDMRPHFWAGENLYKNLYSIYYGPVLLAWRKPDKPIEISQNDSNWYSSPGILFQSDEVGAKLVSKFSGEQINMIYDRCPEGGMIRTIIDNEGVGIIDLYSPELKQLTQWQSPHLKKGTHTLTVEILKATNPASKGSSVRIREFRLHRLPVFDVYKLNLTVAAADLQGVPWLRFTASDRQGNIIMLEDYNSAGKNNGYYYTWLPLEGLKKGSFSKIKPFPSFRSE